MSIGSGMTLGVFARTWQRDTVEAVFAAVAEAGLPVVQLNTLCAGLVAMPETVPDDVVHRIQAAAATHGVEIASLSSTFNMAHPDPAERALGLRRMEVLADLAPRLGATVLSLCTGTRNTASMWHHHPDNIAPEAWADLRATMDAAVAIAERHGLRLGIEPEPGNVVSTAPLARRLLDETGSDRLGIILDPANLIEGVPPGRIAAVIDEAITLLGGDLVMAHAKDRAADSTVVPAGQGVVPWHRFLGGLKSIGFAGPLVLHGLPEDAVTGSRRFLEATLADMYPRDDDDM